MLDPKNIEHYIERSKEIERKLGYKPNRLHLMYKLQINYKFANKLMTYL